MSSSGRRGEDLSIPYGVITQRERIVAYHVLDDKRNATPLMLFFHLASNQNTYSFDFSPARLEKMYGIRRDRWLKAKNELIKKGYLVKTVGKSHEYTFYSMPKQYENISFLEPEKLEQKTGSMAGNEPVQQQDKGLPAARERSPGTEVIPSQETGLPLVAEERSSPDGESNNKYYNKDNKIITKDNIEDSIKNSNPGRIDPDRAREEELREQEETLFTEIMDRFGHLDKTESELYFRSLYKRRGDNPSKDTIKEIRRLLTKLTEEREFHSRIFHSTYRRALKKTLPSTGKGDKATFKDIVAEDAIEKILNKYVQENEKKLGLPLRYYRENCGLWVNGWDEELQQPKVIVALSPLPFALIRQMQHNIEGIPKDYYQPKR